MFRTPIFHAIVIRIAKNRPYDKWRAMLLASVREAWLSFHNQREQP